MLRLGGMYRRKDTAAMRASSFAMMLLGATTIALGASTANATILCKDDKKAGYYVCWDEISRYAVHFPRKHKTGVVKTEAEVLEEGKTAVRRIIAHTGRADRVLLLDAGNRVVEEIPEWKVAMLR